MFSSLRFRLLLTYALLIVVVLGIVTSALVVYLLRNPYEARQEVQRLRLISALALQRSETLGSFMGEQPQDHLQAAVERADALLGVRVAVLDPQGNVVVDSRSANLPPIPFLRSLDRQAGVTTFRDRDGRLWLYSARQMEGGSFLLVAAPRPLTPVIAILRDEFVAPLVRAGLLALGLALLLAVAISRWVAAPLDRMSAAAQDVAGGKYQPILLEGPSEVKALGNSFNEMTRKVQASQQSQKAFVANVSHELKTPLTSIQGFSQAILDGTADTPAALHQAASVIYAEAGRMNRLALDLLDLARLDAGIADLESHPLDLSAVLRSVVERFEPQAHQAQVTLRAEFSELPLIHGDGDRLGQVFSNLVDNALKNTPPGGQVILQTKAAPDGVEAVVSDTGSGIPDDQLSMIFERFYQTDPSRRGGGGRGVGLGLAIAREIVLAHRGSISAHNNPVHGAVFMVKIPVRGSQEETTPEGRSRNL